MTASSFNQAALQNNPLVNPPALPYGVPALDQIQTDHFEPAYDWALDRARANIDAIANNPATPDFANTIEALEFAKEDLGRIGSVFSAFTSSNTSKALQALQQKLNPKLSAFSSDVAENDALYARVEAVYNNRAALNLDAEQTMLLEKTYKGFVRGGAALDPQAKKRLRDINAELSNLSTSFSNNILNDLANHAVLVAQESELDGVPDRAKSRYKAAAEAAGHKGQYLIPMQPPPMDVLAHADNRDLRKRVQEAAAAVATSGQYDNRPLIKKIVELRHEKAQLLGYSTYADYVLSERMAGSPQAVTDFLDESIRNYKPQAEQEFKKLKAFALASGEISEFKPWDSAYYDRKLEEQTLQFDSETLRPYFELETALSGMIAHAEKLFDLKINETSGQYPVYHPEVRTFEICDNQKGGAVVGLFYADYYARGDSKRGGAWMSTLRNRGLENGQDAIPLVMNNCNYPKPAKDTDPTLLSIDDVRTMFHEFGHGLHGLLGEGRYPSLTGANVKWDFVELPSQLMENWLTEKSVLDQFARHYQTGQKLPADLIDKVAESSRYDAASMELGQTYLALVDMAWHNSDPKTLGTVEEVEKSVSDRTSFWPAADRSVRSPKFSHLFSGGYAAGYYSYHWARVMDADVFEKFKTNGLYDRATAQDFRDMILSRGGSEDPAKLYRDFMGRDPDPAALLRREGVTPPPKPAQGKPSPKNPAP